ncbi:hypothetical protein [Nocardioides sp. KR10-350]|uniref:hypothetical protein n=1 Tax=Nocardioides cheoyonin TaxID=3156615 RepID=UPI0032B32F76
MDLTGQLSNPSPELAGLLRIEKPQVRPHLPEENRPKPKQKQVRLSGQQQSELADRYRAGALQREVAQAYGIHVETVRAIIRRSDRS